MSEESIISNAVSSAFSIMIVAMLSTFLWAIPVGVFFNEVLTVFIKLPFMSYWHVVCTLFTLRFIKAIVWK